MTPAPFGALALALVAGGGWAGPPEDDEDHDDPGMSGRPPEPEAAPAAPQSPEPVRWKPAPPATPPVTESPPEPPPPAPPPPAPPPAPPPPALPPVVLPPPVLPTVMGDEPIIKRQPVAEPPQSQDLPMPRVKLGYRRFSFVRVGAIDPGSNTGAPPAEAFDSIELAVYPVSSRVRFGLTTQLGWESGKADRSGDYLLTETLTLGWQRRGKVTPFVEAGVGGGYLRRMQLGSAVPTAYWQYLIDGGVELYFSGRRYVSLSLGYIRPVNAFLRANMGTKTSLTSVYLDTWSFKIGVGL